MCHRRKNSRSNCLSWEMNLFSALRPKQRTWTSASRLVRTAPVLCLLGLLLLAGCRSPVPDPDPDLGPNTSSPSPSPSPPFSTDDPLALDPDVPREASAELLLESWQAYRQQFIQSDGRVIDWEAEGRSTSESQAYAMLRAVLIDDPDTFAKTLKWGEDNLQRRNSPGGDMPGETLWAWKWGVQGTELKGADSSAQSALLQEELVQTQSVEEQSPPNPSLEKSLLEEPSPEKPSLENQPSAGGISPTSGPVWGIIDGNFAVDADIDAATALILASRRWNEPAYLALAQTKLKDIWDFSTTTVGETRYLLPGPKAAFEKDERLILNPSYYAPYAFRLFAQVDPERDWTTLADSSYEVLDKAVALSAAALPSDWVALDRETQALQLLDGTEADGSENIVSHYAFDAYRVWWRVALDAVWFEAPAAERFLQNNLVYLSQQWRSQQSIPAQMSLTGKPTVDYEATSQYGMLYAAFQHLDPPVAQSIFQKKLFPSYQDGIWDDASAYYSQNLAWLGLFPMKSLPPRLLQP